MPEPATLVMTRVVRPGRLAAFRAWADEADAAIAGAPGHRGGIRLEQAGGFHHLLHRFASAEQLGHWMRSPDHARMIAVADRHSVGRDQDDAGAQVTFVLPGESSARTWKTWLVTWLAVLPIMLVVSTAIRSLLIQVPQLIQLVLSSLILTGTLTWLVMPRVHRWSRFWQLENAQGELRKEPDAG